MKRFSEDVQQVLVAAGWEPERAQPGRVDEWEAALPEFQMSPAARRALHEFGGLEVTLEGPGITMARVPFDLRPELASGEDDRFSEYYARVGPLFPLGEVEHGHHFLAIAPDGQVYVVGDNIQRAGRTLDEALERFVRGIELDPVD